MMGKTLTTIFWLVVAALVATGLWYGYRANKGAAGATTQASAEEQAEPPLVRVATIVNGSIEQRVSVTGSVEADYCTDVLPEVSGVLQAFALPDGTPVEEGVEVAQGQVIAVIEHADLDAALSEARANLAVARSAVKEAEVNLADAEREKKRMVALYADGTTTERDRDKALTNCDAAAAALKSARDRVVQADAALTSAQVRYEDATVEAPVRGVVSRRYVDEGSYVSPASPLVRVMNIDAVEIKGSVPGKYFPAMNPNETPTVARVDAYPDDEFAGVVDRVQPELDPATRTAQITVRIANADGRLKPGMFARMEVAVARKENVPIVGDPALIRVGEQTYAFVVRDGIASLQSIRLGLKEGARNQVLEGLSAGDVVIVRGHHLVRDGLRVRTQTEEDAE